MLHNKRNYGILHAKIIKNNGTINLYDTSIYPKEELDKDDIEYNEHKLQLKFNKRHTDSCFNGCYLLITYEQKNQKRIIPLDMNILFFQDFGIIQIILQN